MRSQLANLLSSARVGLATVILAVVSHPVAAWWLLVTALATDYLDGPVARRLGIASAWGSQLDALADTVVAGISMVYLSESGWLPKWAVIAIVVASGVGYAVYRSSNGSWWVRLAIGLMLAMVYLTLVAGFADRAYGWHNYYILVIAVLAGLGGWLYRRKILGFMRA